MLLDCLIFHIVSVQCRVGDSFLFQLIVSALFYFSGMDLHFPAIPVVQQCGVFAKFSVWSRASCLFGSLELCASLLVLVAQCPRVLVVWKDKCARAC